MQILKYIFLLILLGLVATTVYIATQRGSFSITKSTLIGVSRPVAYNYLNDYRNWEDWGSWKEDNPGMTFSYPDVTVGKGASYSWEGNHDGKMTTLFTKQNDSIAQQMVYSGNKWNTYVTFKDTLGKTKVTWHADGKVDFMTKIYATLNGGVSGMIGDMFERSLDNLKRRLTKEIKTFNINVGGIASKQGTFYIKQTTTVRTADVQGTILTMLPKMVSFFRKNKIVMNGKPFVIYEANDFANNTVTFSVCGPLQEEIFMSEESDMSVGFLDPFTGLKTTLTGDYSHRQEALNKAFAYMKEKSISENTGLKRIDVFVTSAAEIRSPSKWITEIYVPLTGTVTTPSETAVIPAATTPAAVPTAAVTMPATVQKPVNVTTRPATTKPATGSAATPVTKPAVSKPASTSTTTPVTKPTTTKPAVRKPAEAKPSTDSQSEF